jgi:hypothetical protein
MESPVGVDPQQLATPQTASSITSTAHRSPFRKQDKLAIAQKQQVAYITTVERGTLQWNVVFFIVSGLVITFPKIQNILVDNLVFISNEFIWLATISVCLLTFGNVITTSWRIFSRLMAIESEGKSKDIPVEKEIELEMPLRAPRTLAREGLSPQSSPSPMMRHVPFSTATPSRFKQATSYATPVRPFTTPARSTPGFSSVYGTPLQTSGPASSLAASPRAGFQATSPLPDTGSPRTNRVAAGRLPDWTEQLRQVIRWECFD